MKEIAIIADNIISPLGFSTKENYTSIKNGFSGIKSIPSPISQNEQLIISSIDNTLIDEKFSLIGEVEKYTKVEKLLLLSIYDTLSQVEINCTSTEFQLIISTTKGNIDLLETDKKEKFPRNRLHLWSLANTIQDYFGTINEPIVLSNACISGVNALVVASRLIREGVYKKILVVGVDIISSFVYSGFNSFKAISSKPCMPFDKNRDGINLGEACGSILLSSENSSSKLKVLGGSISNDANHISGPSRTGDGLLISILATLKESNLTSEAIDLLNAHGTATIYNDEMESKAFKAASLENTSMNSLKGYFGHTLGAAGIIETIISYHSMLNNEVLPTLGFENPGTSEVINISNQLVKKEIKYLLKTASGFGGVNGSIIIRKDA